MRTNKDDKLSLTGEIFGLWYRRCYLNIFIKQLAIINSRFISLIYLNDNFLLIYSQIFIGFKAYCARV